MYFSHFEGILDFLFGSLGTKHEKVILNGASEQQRLLLDISYLVSQPKQIKRSNIAVINQYDACIRIVYPENELDNGGLAAA